MPKAQGVGPEPAFAGVPALFDGTASSDPAGANQISEYHWLFGDGGAYSGPVPLVFHTYAGVGAYTATLTVTDFRSLTSAPYLLAVQVLEVPAPQTAGGGGGTTVSAGGGVASFTHTSPGLFPDVRLASASLRANLAGSLTLLLYCPAGETSCSGTVTLRAKVALGTGKSHRSKKTLLTLGKATFTIGGGTQRRVTLRLSRQALALLARLGNLHAQALIVAHDLAGATHTTNLPVLVRGPAAAHGKHAKH